MEMQRFRIMFVMRMPYHCDNLLITGMDYKNGGIFHAWISAPRDKLLLNHNTQNFPQELIEYLEKEKNLIEKGFYSLKTWELSLFENAISHKSWPQKENELTDDWPQQEK